MAKGKGIVIAGLTWLAASYFSKKENRDKVLSVVQQYLQTEKPIMDKRVAERITTEVATEAGTSPAKMASNEMVAEGGGHTGVHFYNKHIHEKE
ncbi:hypothetical protein [Lysinibacillus piscis]|uniref:Uncharacterized protein n=1 Tax=Lysinibacillus piscis TaxID=2518931 RepID=A0ABQ5NM60_9BACI|nr:hypothetical protein [Lysinibacillus sp. KH24]GLC89424.1 hypothetical protein LYSBPC_25510 [Lysinibacillus sp. KH24]